MYIIFSLQKAYSNNLIELRFFFNFIQDGRGDEKVLIMKWKIRANSVTLREGMM